MTVHMLMLHDLPWNNALRLSPISLPPHGKKNVQLTKPFFLLFCVPIIPRPMLPTNQLDPKFDRMMMDRWAVDICTIQYRSATPPTWSCGVHAPISLSCFFRSPAFVLENIAVAWKKDACASEKEEAWLRVCVMVSVLKYLPGKIFGGPSILRWVVSLVQVHYDTESPHFIGTPRYTGTPHYTGIALQTLHICIANRTCNERFRSRWTGREVGVLLRSLPHWKGQINHQVFTYICVCVCSFK